MIDEVVEMVVEVPTGSRNKYEFDEEHHLARLTRQLPPGLVYPGDYGFIRDSCSEDGDPLDVLLLIDEPTFTGCRVGVVPLGVMWMEDEEGRDPKIIGVMPERAEREALRDISDLPELTRNGIEQFFSIYKDLEPEKCSRTAGFGDCEAARSEITKAFDRYREEQAR